jgi:hypothetical protein
MSITGKHLASKPASSYHVTFNSACKYSLQQVHTVLLKVVVGDVRFSSAAN